jgi:5-methylcytosine-specific restriction protein A
MDYIKSYKTTVANAKKTLDRPVELDVVYSQITDPYLKEIFGKLLPHKKLYFWDFGVKATRELKLGMEIAIICGTNRYDCELAAIIKDPKGIIGDIFGWRRLFEETPWKNVCALKMLNRDNISSSELSEIIRKTTSVTSTFLKVTDTDLKNQTFKEGKSYDVALTKFERNSAARRLCVKHHGATCNICGFDFFKTYGEIGRGFIHVHHKNPISQKAENYEINPITDLVPVCPNCHAMLHSSKDNILPVEELKRVYNKNS